MPKNQYRFAWRICDMDENSKHIYIIISETTTRFGYVLRRVGKVRFNHAAVALDENLNEWYSFARKQYHAALICGLVKENMDRYTLRRYSNVQAVIFRIPVTQEQYQNVRNMIMGIEQDKEYMYNLFSVLTFPLLKGFAIYKAYSCIEFTTTVLMRLGIPLSKPTYQYTPDDLLELLAEYQFFEGNLLDYKKPAERDDYYFKPIRFSQVLQSGWDLLRIAKRSVLSGLNG